MRTDIVNQIKSLPISQRIEIIEEVTQSIRRDQRDSLISKDIESRRLEATRKLRGIAKIEGKVPPTDKELREDRANYLLEKYK